MQELVDTHSHIQSIGMSWGERTTNQKWSSESGITPESVINDALDHGVTRLICVGCDLEDSQLAVDFVETRANCWASIGIHPHEAKEYVGKADKIKELSNLAQMDKVVAIGECGLDYFYEHSTKEEQKQVLISQFEIANKFNMPMLFHVREAFSDFWPIFDNFPKTRGVLHSFTDNKDNLNEALNRGLYIGVNGIATFAKDKEQIDVYRSIPLESLLLETDSPYLTPSPFRGTINTPMRVGVVADFLADLRQEKRQDLAQKTTANARKLFGI